MTRDRPETEDLAPSTTVRGGNGTAPTAVAQNEVCCRPESPCPGQCPECGKHWRALGQAHCAECHAHFNSDSAFDRHHTGTFECIPVEQFSKPTGIAQRPLLVLTNRADGPVWVERLRQAV